jgi:hypothetical protein
MVRGAIEAFPLVMGRACLFHTAETKVRKRFGVESQDYLTIANELPT